MLEYLKKIISYKGDFVMTYDFFFDTDLIDDSNYILRLLNRN